MDKFDSTKYLKIVNEEIEKKGLDTFIPLYPMLRVIDNKLYVIVMLTDENDRVWSPDGNVKPEYWVLMDANTNEILEFNKTDEKDFVIGELIFKNVDDKQKSISKYTIEKTLQYKNYLMNDIKNEELPLQKELSSILGTNVDIDGEKVNLNEYLLSSLEDEIKIKVDELVGILVHSKYGSITYYYDQLFTSIVNEYLNNNKIDKEKMKLCIKIMNHYYDGVIGIDNAFNVK